MDELDAATFDAAIAAGPVVVDFWAPWCRPCHAIEPLLEEMAKDAGGRVAFAKLNIDEHPDIAGRYEVLSIPTVTLFAGGEPKVTVLGARPRGHFERAFSDWL